MKTGEQGELILAIDVGTQSVRAGLVDLTGAVHHLVKTAIEPYFSAQPGWAEQDPEYYWKTVCDVCRQVLAADPSARGRLQAVTVTTQRVTMINVDRDGKPLRPAIVWLDQRKADVDQVLSAPLRLALKGIGLSEFVDFAVGVSRSNWIRQHQPEVWEQTHKFLFLSGFLAHRLTGEFRESTGNVFGAIPFDVKRGSWAGKLDLKWKFFPVEPEKLTELVPPSSFLGHITTAAAEVTGIPAGLPLIAAAADKACDVLGAGCLTPERACISFGTTATINTHNKRYVELWSMMPPYPSAIPGHFYSEVGVVRGLWLVSWFKEEFGLHERQLAHATQASPEELLEELLKEVPAGSKGLICHPNWAPALGQSRATKGAIIGFGEVHTRAYVYRAIIEGLVYALREGAELTERKNKLAITDVVATGGGSKSDAILQITADVFGRPVHRPHTSETSLLGAAMVAAVGLKLMPDFATAVAAMTRVAASFEPESANRTLYDDLYSRVYKGMYKQLLPLNEQIRAITGYPT